MLFLQHVIDSLKPAGRRGIVLDEGVLFRTNETAFVQTKRKPLDDCDLCRQLGIVGVTLHSYRFCRWCLDMGGGLGLGFSLAFDSDGRPVISMTKTGPKAPTKNSWDILPPEVSQRINGEVRPACGNGSG